MLAIVEFLKEYRNFLLGSNITIYTNHKNLLSNATVNNRVFRWKQKIQEFGPVIKYSKGHNNTEADALSSLPMDTNVIEVMLNHPPLPPKNHLLNKNPLHLELIQSAVLQVWLVDDNIKWLKQISSKMRNIICL